MHQLTYPGLWYLNEGDVSPRVPRSAHLSLAPVQTFPTADGWITVAWNDRQMDTPFASAYEDLLVKYGTDYKKVREAYPEAGAMHEFFSGGSVTQRSLPNEQTFNLEGLIGRLRSSSYAPLEGHPNYAPMLSAR